MKLSKETNKRIQDAIKSYPVKRSAVLPLLHLVQDDQGYLSDEAIEWIAAKLNLQPVNVYELVTFYPMLRETPWGKKHVRVCRTLPCALRGSYATCQKLEKKLGVKEGHVRDDGEYSLEFMECLADCGEGPVVMVDEQTYENVDEKKAEKLADLLLKGKLEKSNEFVSYENALVSEPVSKSKKSKKA
mgnify:CR=1 FL=1